MNNAELAETLVAALWADGAVAESERVYLRSKLETLGVSGEALKEALALAETPKTLKDIELGGLSDKDREEIFQEAFIMITSDRKGGTAERDFLKQLIPQLGFSAEQGKQLMLNAAKVAKAKQ